MQTQTQKLSPLPPADPLGARFCQWFNHPYNWIHAIREQGKKLAWLTETRYRLEPRNLWKIHQDPHKYKVIGLRFGNETRYCLIDIDRGSPYHPANNYSGFKDVLTALEEIGLTRPVVIRSSESEGLHLYYFLPKPVPTFALACSIKFALEEAGLDLRPGELESFPNVKSYSKDKPTNYNAHRLPLQFGSCLLDDDGQPLSNDLAQFLDAADLAAANQDFATLQKAIAAAGKRRVLKYTPGKSKDAQEWESESEERIAEGWTGQGQTNELLKEIAVYGRVWKALGGDALIDFVVATAQAAPGYQQWCGHQHEIHNRAAEWSRAAEKHYSPYRSFPNRDGRSYQETFKPVQNNIVNFPNQHNVRTHNLATERIKQAMDHLKATDTLPYGATARAAAIIATLQELTGKGISHHTLYKDAHLPLWHPGQESPEPAQGETLHPNLEVNSIEKSPEPAQGETLHPTPLYEGVRQNAQHPEPPHGSGDLLGIQSLEYWGEREGGILPVATPATASAPATPAAPTAPTAPATPAAPTAPATPTTLAAMTTPATTSAPATPTAPDAPSVPAALNVPANPTNTSSFRMPLPPEASQETCSRITKIWQNAKKHAERVVRWEQLEAGAFKPDERKRRETIAKMQFLYRSGEPLWMAEVEAWVAQNPELSSEVFN